jgi:regulator of replication initiation timing
MMATIVCDECGGKADDVAYCGDCYEKLQDEIKELKSQIADLESENADLESENMDLRKSGEEGGK